MYSITIKEKEYQLSLPTRQCIELEKKLGCNPIQVVADMAATEQLPTITNLVLIFHAMLQKYNHGISIDSSYDLFDDYMEEHTAFDMVNEFVAVLMDCGYIAKPEEEQVDKENESKK